MQAPSRERIRSLRSNASSRPAICLVAVISLMSMLAACSGPGQFVWVDDYRGDASDPFSPYALVPGDVIQVKIFNQDQLTTKGKIRADGKVSLPLVNDVPAAGLTPAALGSDLQRRYKEFVKAPLVTVSVEESRPAVVYVGGEVTKPAAYPIDTCSGVLQAIVTAGGLTVNARYDRIFVLRQTGPNVAPSRIRFTYGGLVQLKGRASQFKLAPGDVVVVE